MLWHLENYQQDTGDYLVLQDTTRSHRGTDSCGGKGNVHWSHDDTLTAPKPGSGSGLSIKIYKNYISHFYIALVISHVEVNQTILAWSFLNRHDNGQNIYQPASSGQLCYAMIWWVRGVQDGEIISKCGVVGLFKFWTWPDSNYDWYFCLTMMDCPDTKSPLTCTQL